MLHTCFVVKILLPGKEPRQNKEDFENNSMSVSSFFFPYLNFTLITVNNIYHSQNLSTNRNETLTLRAHTAPRR